MVTDKVDFKSKEFIDLCKSHQVKELYLFGSGANGNFTSESDVDLIVEIDEPDPLNRGGLLLSLWNQLENLFKRKVDLLTFSSLRNPYLIESVQLTKILIYNGSQKEVL